MNRMRKKLFLRHGWITLWSLIGFLLFIFTSQATATHFRYGHITWKPRPDIAPNTAEFSFRGGFRRNGYSGTAADAKPRVDDIIHEYIGGTSFCFGDGGCTSVLDFKVVSYNVAENWIIGEAILSPHTYPSQNSGGTPFVAYSSSCCRISASEGHINNPDGSYRLETLVDFTTNNTPPRSSGVPIVTCEHEVMCPFNIPAFDEDNDPVTWRLATTGEDGWIVQPGPPFSSFPIGINPSTGVVTWDTTGASLGYYSTQDIIEDRNNTDGSVKTKVPIDYFVKVVPKSVNNPPKFNIPPTPLGGVPLIVAVGQPLNFFVQASDPDSDSVVTIEAVDLPSGAVFTMPDPAVNPVAVPFSWTPAASDVGDHDITFNASDNQGHSSSPHVITIRVVPSPFVNLTINKWGWRFVSPGQPLMVYGIEYKNIGTEDAENVKIVDSLPQEVVYVSSTGGIYNANTHKVTFPIGTLSSGTRQYLDIIVNVKGGLTPNPIKNCSTISTSSNESTTSDNSSCWEIAIQTAHDPNDKAVDPSGNIVPGDTLNYTIQYENTGSGTAFGAYVTDQLDEDVDENTLHIENGGVYDTSTRTIRWDVGDLAASAGGAVTFYIKVRNNALPGTTVSNFATVFFPSVPEETRTNLVISEIPSVRVTADTLPNSKVGFGYSKALAATGGTSPYTWLVVDGILPPGLVLEKNKGKIVGFPKFAGIYSFYVQAKDGNNVTSSPKNFSITVGTGEEEKNDKISDIPGEISKGENTKRGSGFGCGTTIDKGSGGNSGGPSGPMLLLFSPYLWILLNKGRRWVKTS